MQARKVIREIWSGLWYQDYGGNFPTGAKVIVVGVCVGLAVGLSVVMRACQETSYARRDQVIQRMYQQADRDGNNRLDRQERNDLFRRLERYMSQEDAGWSLDDVRKYLSVLPDTSLEKVLEEIEQRR